MMRLRTREGGLILLSLVAVVLLVGQADFDGPGMYVVLTLGGVAYGLCVGVWTCRSRRLRHTILVPPVLPVVTGPDIPQDWVAVRCRSCLRSGFVPPETGKALQQRNVQYLCTECAQLGEAS